MTNPIKSSATNPRASSTPFAWGARTFVVGIINLSPDSFSGDGLASHDEAITAAIRLVAEGADIIDVGGESTRPGAIPISAENEIKLVVPVIESLHKKLRVPISIDTYKHDVALAAVQAGATIINDISGLRGDDALARLAAEKWLPIIVTANQRQESITGDVIERVTSDLRHAIRRAEGARVLKENIWVDPGLGFGKTTPQNLEILRRLKEIKSLGHPVMIGPSRKSFIGQTLGLPEGERLEGTAAAAAIGIAHGADIIRVHDVKEMVRVARLSDAVVRENK